jgi:hypothetical protein
MSYALQPALRQLAREWDLAGWWNDNATWTLRGMLAHIEEQTTESAPLAVEAPDLELDLEQLLWKAMTPAQRDSWNLKCEDYSCGKPSGLDVLRYGVEILAPSCMWQRVPGAHPFTWKAECQMDSEFQSRAPTPGSACRHCSRPRVVKP